MFKRAFTLIELMITLVIIALLFGTGYFYMSGYLPRQRLVTTTTYLESLLKETQSKAITKGDYRYGVIFKKDAVNNRHYACAFADSITADWACTNCTSCQDCSCGEMVNLPSVLFKQDIELKEGCSANAVKYIADADDPFTDTIVFDLKGISYARDGKDASNVTISHKPFNFEIFLVSKQEGIGLKEIEVNSGGMIETVKTGQAGNIPGQVGVGNCVE